MCGIVGFDIAGSKEDLESRIVKCVHSLKHRGPDFQDYFIKNSIHIGHTRLKIIDLSNAANQPFRYSDKVVITHNGEIYNYKALKEELIKLSFKFTTQSDTEVIAAAYLAWGTACFNKIEGMFALCIYDIAQNKLLLARDIFGKKPLYYSSSPFFCFSSELSPFKDLLPKLTIDLVAVNHFLSIGYILNPLTIYKEVKALSPAHYLEYNISNKKQTLHQYWDYAESFRNKKSHTQKENYVLETRDLLIKAVKKRMVGDVPFGIFLSRGIDSGAIASIIRKESSEKPPCFNIGFHNTKYDESIAASSLAHQLGLPFESIDLRALNLEDFHHYLKTMDYLTFDNSAYPIHQLAGLASQKVKFVLTGDGSDELFGGYATYHADQINKKIKVLLPVLNYFGIREKLVSLSANKNDKIGLTTKTNRFFNGLDKNHRKAHYNWRSVFSIEERIAILGHDYKDLIVDTDPFHQFNAYYDQVGDLDEKDQHLFVDAKTWLCDNNLVKLDRNTMAHGLEARSPFLDKELATHLASLPVSLKKDKWLLKQALKGYLPKQILEKRKSGFNSPVHLWFDCEGNEFQFYTKYVLNEKYYSLK